MRDIFKLFKWILALSCLRFVYSEKYRICIVDGKGVFKKSAQYCPELDHPESKVECIAALDRMDCLRRIQKGKADFSVFTPEDLIAASNSQIELLVTNELRSTKDDEYEYEVVAVIDNKSGITSKHDARGKKYCHPGYGYEADWTRILANYFEASTVTPQCNTQLTITENRIKATSDYFEATCKAGPWVNNPILDEQLKNKYPNLCKLCGNPSICSMRDEYWGRRGSLLCLTDGAGDISWARLDDVKQHFGLTPGTAAANPDKYSFLCPDDTVMPVNSSNPCVWVVKPWPVIATARTKAQDIQRIIASLSHAKSSPKWKSNLLNLLEFSYIYLNNLDSVESIESYLLRAKGFLRANSFSACHPPRTITICTTSNIENAKCSWLRESAAVYGIEPDLGCIKADNTTHCMFALNDMAADVVMVPADFVHLGISKYNLKPLFYETVNDHDKYIVVPVLRHDSDIKTLKDLKGKNACFPSYDGIAWNSVVHTLYEQKLVEACPVNQAVGKFFGSSCVPGMPVNESRGSESLISICQDEFSGEFGALHCLTSGAGDVAFVSNSSVENFVSDEREDNPGNREELSNFKILCDNKTKPCYINWAPVGQAMVRSNSTQLWLKDTLDVFQQLDNLFGKNSKFLTQPFTLFGKYDEHTDVLFHDVTVKLRDVPVSTNLDSMIYTYEDMLRNNTICLSSSSSIEIVPNSLFAIINLIVVYVFVC